MTSRIMMTSAFGLTSAVGHCDNDLKVNTGNDAPWDDVRNFYGWPVEEIYDSQYSDS